MSGLLYRLGRGSALHPWRTLALWALAATAVFALGSAVGGTPHDDWDVPNAPAQHGIDLLRAHMPGAGNAGAQVVVHDPDGDPLSASALAPLTASLHGMPHVVDVSDPTMSRDGDTALFTVSYDVPVTDADLMGNLDPLAHAVAATRAAGLQVELGGDLPDTAAAPMQGRGELIGIAAALLILVLAFGSVVGAGLPIGVALPGLPWAPAG
jgi:RND superfamily putative drug exporter